MGFVRFCWDLLHNRPDTASQLLLSEQCCMQELCLLTCYVTFMLYMSSTEEKLQEKNRDLLEKRQRDPTLLDTDSAFIIKHISNATAHKNNADT